MGWRRHCKTTTTTNCCTWKKNKGFTGAGDLLRATIDDSMEDGRILWSLHSQKKQGRGGGGGQTQEKSLHFHIL